jgi:hypothetical protein
VRLATRDRATAGGLRRRTGCRPGGALGHRELHVGGALLVDVRHDGGRGGRGALVAAACLEGGRKPGVVDEGGHASSPRIGDRHGSRWNDLLIPQNRPFVKCRISLIGQSKPKIVI